MRQTYTKERLQEAVNNSQSIAGVLRYFGLAQAGGTQTHIKKQIEKYKIDISHFTGQAHGKGKKSPIRKTAADILIVLPKGSNRPKAEQLNRALQEMRVKYKCSDCGVGNTWFGKKLVLEIDHINGDWLDNRLKNLRYLCPNCHSQQTGTNRSHRK